MYNFKNELIKTGIAAVGGLILGIVCYSSNPGFIFISPFYGIGVVYGWREILRLVGKVLGTGAEASLWSLFFRSPTAGMISIMLMILGIAAVLVFGWLVGIVRAAVILFKSHSESKNIAA